MSRRAGSAARGEPKPARLKLDPDRCDRCGACLAACAPGALKVAKSYIYVDRRTCDGCNACAKACPTGAIAIDAGARTAGKPVKRDRTTAGRESAKGRAKPADAPQRKPRTRAAKARVAASAPASEPGAVAWSTLEALAMLAVVFAGMVVKDAVLNSAWAISLRPTDVVWLRVFVLGAFYTVQISTLYGLAQWRGVDLVSAVRLQTPEVTWASATWAVGAVAGLLVVTRSVGWAYGLAARSVGFEPPVRWSSDITAVFGPDVAGFALSILMVVLVGPVVEEIVFRGVILSALQQRWRMWTAVVASSVLFAAYHFNLWLFVPTLVLAIAAGWLAIRSKTLWPAIVLHALYNAVPVALAFWISA